MSRKRRNHSPDFKAKVALAAIKGDETLSELARRYKINANLIVKWKSFCLKTLLRSLQPVKAWHPTGKVKSNRSRQRSVRS